MERADSSALARSRLAILSAHLEACLKSSSFGSVIQPSCVSAQSGIQPPGDLKGSLTIVDDRTAKKYQVQVSSHGTVKATDLKKITTGNNDKGLKLYDPGYLNTAPVRSSICYIDGDAGILRYRGYPIEELAESSSFLEVAYLLMYGNLPSESQLADWEFAVSQHSAVPQGILGTSSHKTNNSALVNVFCEINQCAVALKLTEAFPLARESELLGGGILALHELMRGQEMVKEPLNRKDYWLWQGVIGKVMSKVLAEKDIIQAMPHDAHPMGVLVSAMSALSVFHPDANPALRLWWERLPWISVVVPMKILKGGEGDKAREEWDVGSRAGSGSSKGKERWRVVEADGAAFEKKAGGKGSEGVCLSEGYARLERFARKRGSPAEEWGGPIAMALQALNGMGWPIKDKPLKEARASFYILRSERWFEEELLVSGMDPEAEKGETGRVFLADAWLLEEDAKYSLLEPSSVCIWGGRVSSSSHFSGVEGALIEVEESCVFDAFVKESGGKLNISPLRVCLMEGRIDQKGVGDFFLLEVGRDERVGKRERMRSHRGTVVWQGSVTVWECLLRALKARS
ncbi:Citrate synthase, glyoxysomal [Vitis vinifera]|uniref:Citrate synthase, glyoxysomal n=1 Tax=Vitis vinifera TaxID=29760 RepID=A0A438DVS2_VITVI|nr:Citrate synthase, glyoxysomal [Vitis vinifera]